MKQFVPGRSSEVLITSADSRIRVVDGVNVIHKFKGFRNTSSQISASLTENGKYIICASEDSHVYVWRKDTGTRPNRIKTAVSATQSYEYFNSQNVTAAVPWPNASYSSAAISAPHNGANILNRPSKSNNQSEFLEEAAAYGDGVSSATWPEERLRSPSGEHSRHSSGDLSNGDSATQGGRLAWGMVIVTASRRGEVRVYQNFGFPVRT